MLRDAPLVSLSMVMRNRSIALNHVIETTYRPQGLTLELPARGANPRHSSEGTRRESVGQKPLAGSAPRGSGCPGHPDLHRSRQFNYGESRLNEKVEPTSMRSSASTATRTSVSVGPRKSLGLNRSYVSITIYTSLE